MSYKVDGTKVKTLSTLLGRVIAVGLGILGGSTIKGTVMKSKGLKNQISVADRIKVRDVTPSASQRSTEGVG